MSDDIPTTKKIFQYYDGCKMVWGDPLTIHRKLVYVLGQDPNIVLKAARVVNSEESAQASERMIGAIRMAFDMQPFDGAQQNAEQTGATEEECNAAFWKYAEFLEKKNGPPAKPLT